VLQQPGRVDEVEGPVGERQRERIGSRERRRGAEVIGVAPRDAQAAGRLVDAPDAQAARRQQGGELGRSTSHFQRPHAGTEQRRQVLQLDPLGHQPDVVVDGEIELLPAAFPIALWVDRRARHDSVSRTAGAGCSRLVTAVTAISAAASTENASTMAANAISFSRG